MIFTNLKDTLICRITKIAILRDVTEFDGYASVIYQPVSNLINDMFMEDTLKDRFREMIARDATS